MSAARVSAIAAVAAAFAAVLCTPALGAVPRGQTSLAAAARAQTSLAAALRARPSLAAALRAQTGLAAAPRARSSRGAAPRAQTGLTEAAAEQIGNQAYQYGIPLMEFLRQARQQTSVTVPDALSDAPLNQLGNARRLDTAANQVIVQPNNDTLYTMGHLDLSRGPLVLHVPAVPNHRYYSFAFLDPYTNVFHYVGTRTTGDGPGNFLITGPGFHGSVPPGAKPIHSRYRRVWLVGRTLTFGPGDLPAVHRIQNGYRLIPLGQYLVHGLDWRPPRPATIVTKPKTLREPGGIEFFDRLGTALAQNPPPRRDAPLLRQLRKVGVGPGLDPSAEHLSLPVLAGLTAAGDHGARNVLRLRTQLAARSIAANDGWFVPPPLNGAFGTDYGYRAVVAMFGLAANRPQEALYIVGAASPGHGLLNGAHRYVLHFPPGKLPPTRYFWSLTMYDGNFHLVANPIHRYELGSRRGGLRPNPDGSLDIYIQRSRPAGLVANWLPAPSGTFEVTLRMYGPRPSALEHKYLYPPIEQTN